MDDKKIGGRSLTDDYDASEAERRLAEIVECPPEALPCPFCGAPGEIVNIDGAWIAGCSAGQYTLEGDFRCRANAIGFHHRTREGALAAWNRRHPGPFHTLSEHGAVRVERSETPTNHSPPSHD